MNNRNFETFKKEYYEANKEEIKRRIRNENIAAIIWFIFIFTLLIGGTILKIRAY